MKISVIVVTHNEKNTIEKKLLKMIRQTKLVDEFIIIDDHSTDHTLEVAERCLHKQKASFRMIRNDQELGKRECYLIGMGMATGDYLLLGEGNWKVDHVEKIVSLNKEVVIEGKTIEHLALTLLKKYVLNSALVAVKKGIVITETEAMVIKHHVNGTLGIIDGEEHMKDVENKEERYEEVVQSLVRLSGQGYNVSECNHQLAYYNATEGKDSTWLTRLKAKFNSGYKQYRN